MCPAGNNIYTRQLEYTKAGAKCDRKGMYTRVVRLWYDTHSGTWQRHTHNIHTHNGALWTYNKAQCETFTDVCNTSTTQVL